MSSHLTRFRPAWITAILVTAGIAGVVLLKSMSPGGSAAAPVISRELPSLFAPTHPNPAPPPAPAPEGMVWIPGSGISMGSDGASESLCGQAGVTRDAVPVHRVYVDAFWMDATEVTNAQFAQFVAAAGYVTVPEKAPTRDEFPTAPPGNPLAASTVFAPTPGPVKLDNYFQWWSYIPGADWRHPPHQRLPWDWRMLLNGKGDGMLYERNGFITDGLPFAELRQRALINPAAHAAGQSPDFSRLIRQGRPGFPSAP